jgi:hypothetical protein
MSTTCVAGPLAFGSGAACALRPRDAIVRFMWTHGQVAELTRETKDGTVRWHRSGEGRLRAERKGESLTLERADDGRHTLTTVHDGEPSFRVLAESTNPPLDAVLTELWDAAKASTI